MNTTIVAQATANHPAGVAMVRLSGKHALEVAQRITQCQHPMPRHAYYCAFFNQTAQPIDRGLLLYFNAPNSFTGENVVELHTHGSTVVCHAIIDAAIFYGATLAQPGEFTQRAFLNNKIDLAQAEAVADLINSQNEQAAKAAYLSLRGDFSKKIKAFKQRIQKLLAFIEADINFSEDLDPIDSDWLSQQINTCAQNIKNCLINCRVGQKINQGIRVILMGEPNVGKSSLFNALLNKEQAIVTNIKGTTRDLLHGFCEVQNIQIELIDSAGIRPSQDPIEHIGIEKALNEACKADLILWITDTPNTHASLPDHVKTPCLNVMNKVDLLPNPTSPKNWHYVSAKKQMGLQELKQSLLTHTLGVSKNPELPFLARKRHIIALEKTLKCLEDTNHQLFESTLDVAAHSIQEALENLHSITGEKLSHDQLLQSIFSEFCLGK